MWDTLKDLPYAERRRIKNYMDIEFREPIFSELDSHAVEGIRQILMGETGIKYHCIDSIQLLDDHTIEIVYHGDGEKKIKTMYRNRLEDRIQSWFGEHWRLRRKVDHRRHDGRNKQRFVLRRVEGYHVQYPGQSDEEWEIMMNGTPEGVPDDVSLWAEVDGYGDWPSVIDSVDRKADLFVYTSSSGTQHLMYGYGANMADTGLRRTSVASGYTCPCGTTVDRETLAEGSDVKHYRHYVEQKIRRAPGDTPVSSLDLDPQSVLSNLCGSCWKSYGVAEKRYVDDGMKVVGYNAPSTNYAKLHGWCEHE
jgi:hypothetical protein